MGDWRELAAERKNLWNRANAITSKPACTQDELNEADRLLGRMADLARRIQLTTTEEELRRSMRSNFDPRSAWGTRSSNHDPDNGHSRGLREGLPRGLRDSPEYEAAFSRWLRCADPGDLPPEDRALMRQGFQPIEARDLGVGVGASGGFIVPPQFLQQLVEAQLLYGGMRSVSTIINTSGMGGADLPVPTDNDTAQVGAILAEAGALPIQDIGAFAQVVLHSYMYTSKMIKVSIQLLQDAFFPLEPYLARKLGIRLARIQNAHFTTGTGTGQPNGVLTAAALGKAALTGQTTTIIYDDLVDLVHSVDPAYRAQQTPGLPAQLNVGSGVPNPRPVFMMNDQTLKVIQKIKDTQNRPIWSGFGAFFPGLAAAVPETILGFPYILNPDMPVPAANAKSIAFGDFSNYFVRDALDVQVIRLNERFMDNLQVAFLAFMRSDGNLINAGTGPVKYFQHSAT